MVLWSKQGGHAGHADGKKAHSDEQILRALHQAKRGERAADICREARGQRIRALYAPSMDLERTR